MEKEKVDKTWIAGFWRRLGAFIIDSIILGIVGYILGVFFSSWFIELGAWGRLLGFTIALLYFGLLNSKIFDGQTLGKKAFEIKVVDSNNNTIGVFKSFARYAILAIPFFLNGAQLPDNLLFSPLKYLLAFLVFGGILAIVYLYIFNRKTRQSLHDIIIGTYVVNIDTDKKDIQAIWKPHLLIVGLIFIASALIPIYTTGLINEKPLKELQNARAEILKNDAISNVVVMYGWRHFISNTPGKNKIAYVMGRVFLKKDKLLNKNLALEIAKIIAKNYTDTMKKDVVYIIFTYGYDIGITSRWKSRIYRFKPSELVQ